MIAETIPRTSLTTNGFGRKRKIPAALIKETIDGIPFYYAGFRNERKKATEFIGLTGGIKRSSFIKSGLIEILLNGLDLNRFHLFAGEIGCQLGSDSILAIGLAIFEKTRLPNHKINTKYIDVAPNVVIEIDVNVEVDDRQANLFEEFVLRKVKKLHAFGTEKVIWIFTKSKMIVVAKPGGEWQVLDWDCEIELIDGIKFNLAEHLKNEGILLDF